MIRLRFFTYVMRFLHESVGPKPLKPMNIKMREPFLLIERINR